MKKRSMAVRFVAVLLAAAFALGAGGCAASQGTAVTGTAASTASAAASPAVAGSPASGVAGRYIQNVFSEIEVARDIQYGAAVNESGQTENLLLDVYQPKGDKLASRPAVIFVHGGGFTGGDKASGIEAVLAASLARKGYVALSVNYRLRRTPNNDWAGTFRDADDDAYTAFAWLVGHKDEYRVDTGHIAFGGHSAGSNIVTDLCYSDWSGRPIPKDGVFAVISMAGPQMYYGSPQAGDPFDIIIHGENDDAVSCPLSVSLSKRLDKIGMPHVLNVIPNCRHDLLPAIDEVEDVITAYLYKAMTGEESGIQIRRYGK